MTTSQPGDPLALRVLDPAPVESLHAYRSAGGGEGLEAAHRLGPAATVEEVVASGLRGRGGAGFPTGVKWQAVLEHASASVPTTVVVNAAEGEPGSFKDREIIRRNPYRVLEGALIAGWAVEADRIIVALKGSFGTEVARLRAAAEEVAAAGWTGDADIEIFEGPGEYLYGEETALLEVLAGRPPFPRIAPPFRHGADELSRGTPTAAATTLAAGGQATASPPTLVNNTETVANLPGILARSPDWFRSVGTPDSPGTIVCTVTGAVRRAGVGEVAMGTPLGEIVDRIGGGARDGRRLVALMSGVASPLVVADRFDTPATYEDLLDLGSSLGAAAFMVFDDESDMAAVAAGVSRFLFVESCGQCTPCKEDGRGIFEHLATICRNEGTDMDVVGATDRVGTVAEEARCYLAHQHQEVVGSILELFPDAFTAHLEKRVGPVQPAPIVAISDLVPDAPVVLDEAQLTKQPDWTHDAVDSGQAPAQRIDREQPGPAR